MKVITQLNYATGCISWTSFHKHIGSIKYSKVYSAYIEDSLVGYLAMSKHSQYQATNKTNNFQNIAQISLLEIHPDHRRSGIATVLMKMVIEDYKDQNLMLECIWDEALFSLYSKLGFVVFYRNHGSGGEYFMKLLETEGNDFETFMQEFDKEELYPEHDISYAGTKWSIGEKRFIRPGRTYQEEINAIKHDPWELALASKQTPELQELAIRLEPQVIDLITFPTSETRKIATMKDCRCFKPLESTPDV